MRFNFSGSIALVSTLLILSAAAAPVDDMVSSNFNLISNNSTPVTSSSASTTYDPMSGATALASITIMGSKQNENGIKAQSLSTSGAEKTVVTGFASLVLLIFIIFLSTLT